jgi:hypothetical protein
MRSEGKTAGALNRANANAAEAPAATSLIDAIEQALVLQAPEWAGTQIQALPDAGLVHAHLRMVGTGLLARVPKQSQLGLSPAEGLAYEAACFEKAGPSGHVPQLHAVLPPSEHLPRGALLVEEIVGRAARLPDDLPALMQALAQIHALPLPRENMRSPLRNAADPLADLQAEIAAQAQHVQDAGLTPTAARAIEDQLQRFQRLCAASARPPRSLISFDAHPGNFIVRPDGKAILVDLEKGRYAAASLDLAHATLYTSTTWDISGRYALSVEQVADAWTQWLSARGPQGRADVPWHLPLRRAMWLWSITWCAMWRVQSGRARGLPADAQADWSEALSEPALVNHVRGRVDHYLEQDTILRVIAEFDALGG